jgi:hypothetical protein
MGLGLEGRDGFNNVHTYELMYKQFLKSFWNNLALKNKMMKLQPEQTYKK